MNLRTFLKNNPHSFQDIAFCHSRHSLAWPDVCRASLLDQLHVLLHERRSGASVKRDKRCRLVDVHDALVHDLNRVVAFHVTLLGQSVAVCVHFELKSPVARHDDDRDGDGDKRLDGGARLLFVCSNKQNIKCEDDPYYFNSRGF